MSAPIRARGPWQLAFERLARDRWAIVAGSAIGVIVAVAVFAPLVARVVDHPPEAQYRETGLSPSGIPVGPGRAFLLGTDGLDRVDEVFKFGGFGNAEYNGKCLS